MASKLLSLSCHRCGAPISVPQDIQRVTCGHCGTMLTVEHEGDVYFTRELQELNETTRRIDEKVDDLHAALMEDRRQQDWVNEQAQALLGSPSGAFQTIGFIQRILVGATTIPFAIIFLMVGWQFHPFVGLVAGCIPLLGGLAFVLASHRMTSHVSKVSEIVNEAHSTGHDTHSDRHTD